MMEEPFEEMPLFPLRTVLFPGMPLPLHVFEERYKLMINECMDHGRPFGVVLIKEGPEVGGPAIPHRVGTSAIITQTKKLEGDRLSIVSVGYQRFRIHSMVQEHPFLTAKVEILSLVDENTKEAVGLAAEVRTMLEDYMEVMGEATDKRIEVSRIPSKPALLAFLTAILLQAPLADKQRLLGTESIAGMLALEVGYLKREQHWLEASVGAEYLLEKNTFSNS